MSAADSSAAHAAPAPAPVAPAEGDETFVEAGEEGLTLRALVSSKEAGQSPRHGCTRRAALALRSRRGLFFPGARPVGRRRCGWWPRARVEGLPGACSGMREGVAMGSPCGRARRPSGTRTMEECRLTARREYACLLAVASLGAAWLAFVSGAMSAIARRQVVRLGVGRANHLGSARPSMPGSSHADLDHAQRAGVIIGRGGATIATLRSDSNVKAGVSKVVPGVADRILSVGGSVDGVAKVRRITGDRTTPSDQPPPTNQAYSIVAQTILENPVPALSSPADAPAPTPSTTTVRLLISHLLIGSVIGKGGAKIRQIQDISGARMVASKEMLPQSTERIVEVSGGAEGIRLAVAEISKCLIEDWDRAQGTVLYHPGAEGGMVGNGFPSNGGQQAAFGARRISSGGNFNGQQRRTSGGGNGDERAFTGARERNSSAGNQDGAASPQARRTSGAGADSAQSSDPNYREQKISIPSDMVYGPGRPLESVQKLTLHSTVDASSVVPAPRSTRSVASRAARSASPRRRTTRPASACLSSPASPSAFRLVSSTSVHVLIVPCPTRRNNEKALFLLYNQLESEKERRVQSVAEEEGAHES